jgi:hypothetical protein
VINSWAEAEMATYDVDVDDAAEEAAEAEADAFVFTRHVPVADAAAATGPMEDA